MGIVYKNLFFGFVNFKNYGQTFISDDQFLTLANTVAICVNIPSRMIWGFFIDRAHFKVRKHLRKPLS